MIYKKIILVILLLFSSNYAQHFRFGVWGDSQFQNPDVFQETVRRTELLNPAFVIHVGDMIHGYTYNIDNSRRQWVRFKKQIAVLSSPFYPTPGNHDVTTKEIQPAYLEAWGNDKLYYSFDFQNSHFIILNTYLNQNFDTIPEEEFEWLKKDLEQARYKENIFISMHSPLYLNANYDWDKVHNLLKNYPVRAVFTGHYHSYDFRDIDSIKYFCLNSSGNMGIYNELAGRSHNFLIIDVEEKKIKYSVVTKENIYLPDFVLPGESKNASILEGDETIIINSPADGIDTSIYIRVKNKADYKRTYIFQPGLKENWSFEPYGYKITLSPGQKDSVNFRVKYKGPFLQRNELPSINVTTDYISLKKIISKHQYSVNLFHPPVTTALNTSEKIILDGIDNEYSWRTKGITKLFVNNENKEAEQQTDIKILYDESNLYVFVKGEEPDPEGLSSSAYGDIPLVFGDDDFELYFDTKRDFKTFYRLMVNPAGTILSSGPEGRFTFKFDVKTNLGENYWAAEFKIPLKELKITGSVKDSIWGFNVRRHRQQAEIPQSDWSKMNIYPPYQPEFFGLLKFQ